MTARLPVAPYDADLCHRTIVRETSDLVFTIDRGGRVLDLNPAALRVIDREREDVVGRHLTEIFPAGMASEHLGAIGRVFETGEAQRTLRTSIFPRGRLWLDTHLFPIRDGDGNVVAVTGVSRDVSAREDALSALLDEKERLAVTLASIGEGVITTDTRGRVTGLNPVARRLTGWDGDSAVGREIESVYHVVENASGRPLENPVRAILAGPRTPPAGTDKVLIRRDGGDVRIEDTCAPILRGGDEILGAVLVFRDIGRQRALEDEMRRSERLESIGILAGGIAHDFNNILTVLLGNLNVARRRGRGDQRVVDCLAEAETAVARARELTGQLLTFSRGGAPIKSRLDIRVVVDDAARFALSGTGRELVRSFSADSWTVEADPTQLGQVIQNLVQNAHQATPGPEPIEVSVRNLSLAESAELSLPGERHVRIAVVDRGVGIPPEIAARVFDPYFTTRDGGTGLGLATAYSIIQRHGGHIALESRPQAGSSFVIHLPASRPEERESTVSLTPPRGTGVATRGRVLVLDDDPAVLDVAGRMLEELGYRFQTAADGQEAADLYRSCRDSDARFDAVILDVNIPGGTGGREAAALIRKIDRGARLLVSSGYSEDPVMAEWQSLGFDAVLAKPYDLDALDRALRRVLARKGPGDPRGAGTR